MKTFWDKIASVYDIAESINGKVYREMVAYTAHNISEGSLVLDCAAGTGALSIAAAGKVGAAGSVMCTDLSENMLDMAKKKAAAKGINNISFGQRDIYSLEDEDEKYDVVIAGNVLHLLDEPEKALAELSRVTKRGGKMLLPTFFSPDTNFIIKAYKLLGFDPKSSYNTEKYEKLLSGCGFKGKIRVIKGLIPCGYAVIVKE